jgi:hypothetical protein
MLFGLMGLTALVQIGAIVFRVLGEIDERNAYFQATGKASETFFAPMSFTRAVADTQFWFAVPIGLSIATLVLYAFLIWYRDWIGRNTFVYRLLALPAGRKPVYFAKLTALLTFVFAMVGFQLLLMPIAREIYTMIAPADQLEFSYIADALLASRLFSLLLPGSFGTFVVHYGLGIIGVLVAFTAILLERSFRLIGIAYGLAYAAFCVILVSYPAYVLSMSYPGYLYVEEMFAIQLAILLLVALVSIWLALYLLKKKVSA